MGHKRQLLHKRQTCLTIPIPYATMAAVPFSDSAMPLYERERLERIAFNNLRFQEVGLQAAVNNLVQVIPASRNARKKDRQPNKRQAAQAEQRPTLPRQAKQQNQVIDQARMLQSAFKFLP